MYRGARGRLRQVCKPRPFSVLRPAAHRAGRAGLHGPERRPLLLPRRGEGQQEGLLLLRRLLQDTHHRSEERHVRRREDE